MARIANRILSDTQPLKFGLFLLADFGRIVPKGQGTFEVCMSLLRVVEGLVDDSPEWSQQETGWAGQVCWLASCT